MPLDTAGGSQFMILCSLLLLFVLHGPVLPSKQIPLFVVTSGPIGEINTWPHEQLTTPIRLRIFRADSGFQKTNPAPLRSFGYICRCDHKSYDDYIYEGNHRSHLGFCFCFPREGKNFEL